MRQLKISLALALILASCSAPQKAPEKSAEEEKRPSAGVFKAPSELLILDHQFFKVAYDPSFRLARYVEYVGTSESLKKKKAKRRNRFFTDPQLVKLGLDAVKKAEYLHSGYDQGHLAPSADFSFSQEANDETFVLSNMAPQKPALNRDAWRHLEGRVRKWICGEGRVRVYSGPVLEAGLSMIGNRLPIPKHFFKVLLDETPPKKVIAFLYGQEDKGDVYRRRVVPYAKVKELVELPLEQTLSQSELRILEEKPNLATWKEKNCD